MPCKKLFLLSGLSPHFLNWSIVSDNAGAYDCCIDLLTRAQISLAAKIRIREMLVGAIARLRGGLPVRVNRFAGDQYRTISLALYELITQAEPYISAK